MTETTYVCPECEKIIAAKEFDPIPTCCGGEMKIQPLPFCTTAPNPEMARSAREDAPCDDGTNPQKI